jgi:hypothetical protein
MKRIKGNPVGALASWLRQNEDVPGVTEALAKYKRTLTFTNDEYKHASAIRESTELQRSLSYGMKKVSYGLYFKESTQIVYKVDKSGNTCSWRPQDRDWWSKSGDMNKLTLDYNAGKVVMLTKELASKLGLQNGICVVCGMTLTTKKSKELGIGPVCIKTLDNYEIRAGEKSRTRL